MGASASPVTRGEIVYYPTWDGTFAALDYKACRLVWEISIADIIAGYAPISRPGIQNLTKAVSRTSPQIEEDVLFLGTQTHALVVALNRTTGQALHVVQINPHPYAIITQSPTFSDGMLFIGTASLEHLAALDSSYRCCSFIGNFAALTFTASAGFRIVWNVTTISAARQREGWAGASIWGSQPSIDLKRRHIYIGTGNAYSAPNSTIQCQKAHDLVAYVSNDPDPCLPGDVWQDSVIALDIDTGAIPWVHQTPGVDAYSAACGYPGYAPQNTGSCPQVPGPDADFGMAPAFVRGPEQDVLVLGRKNGFLYALAAQDGRVLWQTRAGPGGIGGGLSWGVAVDENRVYHAVINTGYAEWNLLPSNRETTNRSLYGAVALSDGSILWQTAVPRQGICAAPPTVVGDVVLFARTGQDPEAKNTLDLTKGGLVAVDKTTGRVLIDYDLPSNMHSGITVQNQFILLGTGYDGSNASPRPSVPGGFHVLSAASST